MKITIISLCLLISFTIIANDFDRYLIPYPQAINTQIENDEIVVSNADSENLNKLFKDLSAQEFNGKINILSWYYGINSIAIRLDSTSLKKDAYILKIDKKSIKIMGQSNAAIYYAKKTLLQLLSYSTNENKPLPCLKIVDYPDFERRGFMLDISRDKVPTMESLYSLIDLLADLKINEIQLYVEHSFAYENHSTVWENSSPLTAEEVKLLDDYCRKKYIDLVPNQNSFGHMENWLKHDEYLELAECPTTVKTIWGQSKLHSLDPTNPKSFELMQELYAEMLPNFSSKYFNIGCDETVELGLGKSAPICNEKGKGRVYLEYLIKLNDEANKNGKLTQFWGDIIVNHPELIPELPQNMTAMVWGYSASFPAGKNLPKFKEAGLDFYVCPGTSTWNSLIGRNENAFENLKNAAQMGKEYGAKGYLNTSWGDYGHWQPLSVTYPAMLIGASYAWNYTDKAVNDLEFQLNHYIFKDTTANTAKAILQLGNAYLKNNIPNGNGNAFHLMLFRYKWTLDGFYQTKELNIEGLQDAEDEINNALLILSEANPQCADSATIISEVQQAANLALHGIHLGIARLYAKDKETVNIPSEIKVELANELKPLIDKHRDLWILRNRVGGLDDSAGKLENLLNYYGK